MSLLACSLAHLHLAVSAGFANFSSLSLTPAPLCRLIPTDHHGRAVPHPLPEGEVALLYPEPLRGSALQAGGLLRFRLCHQPVLHRHCQSVRRALAAAFPGGLRPGFLHHQLREGGLHPELHLQGKRQQGPGSQVRALVSLSGGKRPKKWAADAKTVSHAKYSQGFSASSRGSRCCCPWEGCSNGWFPSGVVGFA